MRTLIGTVTDRALESFEHKDDPINHWEKWTTHWVITGEKFVEELEAEGLTLSAQSVRQHVETQKKLNGVKGCITQA